MLAGKSTAGHGKISGRRNSLACLAVAVKSAVIQLVDSAVIRSIQSKE
jgi:hypothetical protein